MKQGTRERGEGAGAGDWRIGGSIRENRRVVQAEEAGAPAESFALLQAALSDGFGAALRVDAASADACVGQAECHVALARLFDAGGLSPLSHKPSTV